MSQLAHNNPARFAGASLAGLTLLTALALSSLLAGAPIATAAPLPASFAAAPILAAGISPVAAAVADFDGDGVADLATVNQGGDPGSVSIMLNNGSGRFAAPANHAVGVSPSAVAVGDFNGDGVPDLAVTNEGPDATSPGTVSILAGNGSGGFSTHTNYNVGIVPVSVAVGDFNGDGKADLAVANEGNRGTIPALPGSVSVLLNNGSGGFASATPYVGGIAPNYPTSIAVVDLDGDGKADLAMANQGEDPTAVGHVAILLGDGSGAFVAHGDPAVAASSPTAVAAADFNSDGKNDLAVSSGGYVSTLLGDGTGGFTARVDDSLGTAPSSVTVGDFHGDGKADLATANPDMYTASILLNDGSGGFAKPVDYSIGPEPDSVAVGDFNGDGKDDLATATSYAGVWVLFNDGHDGFVAAADHTVGSRPSSIAVSDFNGDGKTDMATANANSDDVSILLGDGSGGFSARVNYTAGSQPSSIAVGDFNNDGNNDLAVTSGNFVTGTVSILLGDGSGSFAAALDYSVGKDPQSVAVGDFNGDGNVDLATANEMSDSISILLGDGKSGFAAPVDYAVDADADAVDAYPVSVAVADLNGDGNDDLTVADQGKGSGDGRVSVLLGTGGGSFALHVDYPLGANPDAVAAADFNGDSAPDLAVANGDTLSVLLNEGSGTFAAPVEVAVGANSVAVVDLNGDGKADLATTNGWSNLSILLGTGGGDFAERVDYGVGLGPRFVAAGDFNGDGKADLATASYWDPSVSVVLNTTEPVSGVMRLNSGATYAKQVTVTVNSVVSGATWMRFRDSGGQWASWEPYAAARSWTLPTGDGTKTVEAQYKNDDPDPNPDVLALSDNIFLDATKPTTHVTGLDALWHRGNVTLTFLGGDSVGGSGMKGGLAETRFKLDSGAWTKGASVTVTALASHAHDGLHTVSYCSVDAAGNVEATKSATVRIDTLGPATSGKATSGVNRRAITLKYYVDDKFSPKVTSVVLAVKNSHGKVVKSFSLGTKTRRVWYYVKWSPTARGTYTYATTAKDLAGNRQSKAVAARVTVR
jgi:hypothetical protein